MASTGTAEIVTPLPRANWMGEAVLVRLNGQHYAISSTDLGGRPETMAFEADERGEVMSWRGVAGGYGMSQREVIAELERLPVVIDGEVVETPKEISQ